MDDNAKDFQRFRNDELWNRALMEISTETSEENAKSSNKSNKSVRSSSPLLRNSCNSSCNYSSLSSLSSLSGSNQLNNKSIRSSSPLGSTLPSFLPILPTFESLQLHPSSRSKYFDYNSMENSFNLRVKSIKNMKEVLDFLADDLKLKTYWSINIKGYGFNLKYQQHFRETLIGDNTYMCLGFITIRKDIAEKLYKY